MKPDLKRAMRILAEEQAWLEALKEEAVEELSGLEGTLAILAESRAREILEERGFGPDEDDASEDDRLDALREAVEELASVYETELEGT